MSNHSDEPDTVIVYHTMREATNHQVASILSQSMSRGGTVPHAVIIEQISQIGDVHEVPTREYDPILAATAAFRRRHHARAVERTF